MGEHAMWANLEEPIYAAKDLEVFRPLPKQSTLPMYYVKGWLPFSADTLFNALLDARYRTSWDSNVQQVHVVEHQLQSDVLYFAMNLPWPLANRDYVYRRRATFYPDQNAFVVVCHAAHHADVPANSVRVRVETCTLRMCIRSASNSNDACDFHVEYEDDTNFSLPNYVVNLLLHTMVPSFMAELRTACAGYVSYIKTLDDDGVQSIPSQVVRHRCAVAASVVASVAPSSCSSTTTTGYKSTIGSSATEGRKPVKASPRTRGNLFFSSKRKKKAGLLRRQTDEHSSVSEDMDVDDAPRSEPPSWRSPRPLLSSSHTPASTSSDSDGQLPAASVQLGHSSSTTNLPESSQSGEASIRRAFSLDNEEQKNGPATPLDDDFTVEFRKQKIGLHLETDLFSNKVLVAFCEKDSEAAACSKAIEPGFLVTSVNGVSVSEVNFTDILSEIQRAPRPLTLGFTHPDREASRQYRRFKEPHNVLRCLVSRSDNDLLRALRPLDEDAAVSAVLKCDFSAQVASETALHAKLTASSSSSDLPTASPLPRSAPHQLNASMSLPLPTSERITVPEGYLVYEIDDCYVLDLPFAEIAHLLRRNGNVRVVTFKAALAVVGGRRKPRDQRKISNRISGVFKWRSSMAEDVDSNITTSTCSSSSREGGSGKSLASLPSHTESPATVDLSDECLSDYSTVAVTAANLDWVWQHVQLLKATERIFSAALLIDKLEAFLMGSSSVDKILAAAKTRVLRSMHDEREFLANIKERRDQGVTALKEFNDSEGDDQWQFGQTLFGVTTSWKPDDDGSVWIKLEGFVDGVDIFNTISVIREVDLFSVWTPFCSESQLMQDLGRVELVAYLAISSPFLQRDTLIRAFGINAVYESRCLLLLGGSVAESTLPSSLQVPTLRGWSSGRMEIRGFRALIEPITRTKARTCIVANIDPKCAIPKPMLNFGIKKMAGILLYLIRKEAEKIEHAQNDLAARSANEHLRRIKTDPSGFYTWLRPIVDKYFDDMRDNLLPTPLPLTTSDSQLDWATAQDGTLVCGSSNSRTGSPRLAKRRSSSRIAAFRRHTGVTSMATDVSSSLGAQSSTGKRTWSDYLHDFIIWPYLLLFVFAQMSAGVPFLQACGLKFAFSCCCTWLGVPGAFSRATRQWKRARNELEPLRRQCVVLAAIVDVVSSWALRMWVRWVQCYVSTLAHGSAAAALCFARTPEEVRETEQFWLLLSCGIYASVLVGVQIVVNL
ncbi:hypothetical protein BBJ28_00003673 [Nothophytophthora sp. Chile5]|nr:hypothetical protein BBJ28_00003673 [Nothophytophthora sp. Chile5]